MDLSQYLEMFIDETKEHLQNLNDQVLVLEAEPDNIDTVNEIFRAAHSLKGMAGTMGFKRMQRLTHDMENVFSEIRNGKMGVTPDLVDVVFKCLDAIEEYLDCIINTSDEGENDNEDIIKTLNACLDGESAPAAPAAAPAEAAPAKEEVEATPAEATASDDKRKFLHIDIADFEKNAISEAKAKNLNVYGVTVYIDENCILKAARAFLVFKGVEAVGEIIKSVPGVQDIEDERFDFDFSMLIISEKNIDEIKKIIADVSEIKEVIIENYEIPSDVEVVSSVQEKKEKKQDKEDSKKKASPAKTNAKPVANRSVRVDIEKLDVLMNLVSELIIAKNGLVSASSSTLDENKASMQSFNEQIEYLERVTTNLHESVMKVRMVPIESVVSRFPRMIRDLSKKLGKEMELIMTGEETELDRTVIDEIGDPLMHMLRNSADHGLESTIDRLKLGKPQCGTIQLNAYQDGNNVTIEVIDDGAGIDVEKVKRSAIEKGHITEEQAEQLSDKEAIDLLFRPAFSTAEKISDVSGRGVGLDVVKNKIEGLGGDVEVSTKLGEGTKFTVRLPLTLAIIQALMVEVRDEKYAIPLNSIVTIEDIPVSDIKYVQQKEVINLRGTVIPIVRLDEILDCEPREEEPENLVVVIVKKGDKQTGLVIDNLLGQQEIVIKPLGKYINIHKIISGATILGDGGVALIIDSNSLV
ncbi:MAG: chemotaxis protein CheA [Lachnospiraceae bacterium]|jgi:two-component system chemotaxis sensor kinase CheA|nr:chemotaxis protein CheA [Lachnospiraceae bacterium]